MINQGGARLTRCRLQKTLFMLLILAYLSMLGYFLTFRPGGAGDNPVVVWAITAFASGGMMFMGMFAVALYLFRRKEKAALYFALICAGAAVRFFFMEGSQTVMALVPDFPHSAIYGVRYIAIGCCIVGITGFIYEHFEPPEKFRKPFIVLSAVTVAAYILHAVLAALHDGDDAAMRMLVVLPTLGIQLLSLVIIVRSPAFKSSRLNQFYFVTMLMYMAEAVLLGVFINRFANLGVVSQSFFVIVHTVMLSERYSSAITKNEMLIKFGKTKYHFLQDMNHEFRTPLSVIAASIAYTRIQIDEGGDLKPARDILKTAEAETLRVGRMLDGMVELARMDELGVNRERTDFAELLARCVGRLKRVTERQNTGITLNTAPGMPDVFVERDKLSQAVVCLLTNTLSHTPDGHITITTDFDSSVITTRVSGGEISEEGLLVCRTVLDAHGGTLELMPETGIVFTVPVYGGQEAGHG